MSMDLRILYMGTPEFAVPSLQIIVQAGFSVVGVVTAPDKPSGRGQKLSQSPVKTAALELGIEVLQPTNLKSDDFAEDLKRLNPNLGIVVAFRMLPESVWSYPELGTFNLHGSLLPKYRGAAPINWAIMNGEKKTGVTTFFLKHEIDTGQIIMQDEELISDSDSVGDVYARLLDKGAE
jgi:methionyl-tRNA formyltransferase